MARGERLLQKTRGKHLRPRVHKFNHGKYRIVWKRPRAEGKTWDGMCDPPTKAGRSIFIDPKLRGKKKLQVLIDESIHANLFDWDNDAVFDASDAISSFLWRCGLRFIDEEEVE